MDATITPAPTQDISDIIEQKKEVNSRNGLRNGIQAAVGLGIYAVATVLFPPAGIGGLFATAGLFYGSWFGWDLVKNLGTENSLERAKSEAQEDPTFAKTARRAEGVKKLSKGLGLTVLVAAVGIAASIIALAAAPLTLVAAIASPVLTLSLCVGMIAGVGQMLTTGSFKAAEAVVGEGQKLARGKQLAALEAEAASLKGPAPVTNAPSPSVGFDKAANGNAPAAPEAKDNTPIIKPDVPKVG